MSLDLYIVNKTPRKRVSSRIYVRENGETKEVLTLKEFKKHFPDCDENQFQLKEVVEENLWEGNVTHNLTKMAEHIVVGQYDFYMLLWHPNDNGFHTATKEYRELIYQGLSYMLSHRKELEQYNPENGWGSYDSLLSFVQSYAEALSKLDADDYKIYAWT